MSLNSTNQFGKTLAFGEQKQLKEKTQLDQLKLDEEYANSLKLIEQESINCNKHEKIRIDLWLKKLSQFTSNLVWKQNRNLYSQVLQEMVISKNIQEPFSKVPPEGPLPRLTKYDIPVNLRQKFWKDNRENENNENQPPLNANTPNKNSTQKAGKYIFSRNASFDRNRSAGRVKNRLSQIDINNQLDNTIEQQLCNLSNNQQNMVQIDSSLETIQNYYSQKQQNQLGNSQNKCASNYLNQQEFIKLQDELQLAKQNEIDLKNEINSKLAINDQLNKGLEQSNSQALYYKQIYQKLLPISARIIKLLVENSAAMQNQQEFVYILNDLHILSLELEPETKETFLEILNNLQNKFNQISNDNKSETKYQVLAQQIQDKILQSDKMISNQLNSYLEQIKQNGELSTEVNNKCTNNKVQRNSALQQTTVMQIANLKKKGAKTNI